MGALEESVEAMLEAQKKIMISSSINAFNQGLRVGEADQAHEALQDDYIKDLVDAIIETMERNVTIEYDENEDGKFTWAELDTPNIREALKDDIAEYILERK